MRWLKFEKTKERMILFQVQVKEEEIIFFELRLTLAYADLVKNITKYFQPFKGKDKRVTVMKFP